MDNTFTSYKMEERSYVSYIKREIHNRIARGNFSNRQTAEIDIIVSEMTSNIIKHAGGGELLFRVDDTGDLPACCEMISIDHGPGIADPIRMSKDGVSTTQTLGQGLGAINRLSDFSQIYSIPGWGTIHYAMVQSKKERSTLKRQAAVEVRALCVNKPREIVCGDGYKVKRTRFQFSILFGDGLGHGVHAKQAIDTAANFFSEFDDTDPVHVLRHIHENIRRTRGLVGVVATCDLQSRQWRVCGVGNIFARMYNGMDHKNYMSYNGTIGLTIPTTMNPSVFPMETNQHLVMCTDGIQTRWDLNKYPSILKYDNIVLAAAIYKDHNRKNDDASVLVAKVL